MRNRHWLQQDYFDCLCRHGVSHVLNSWDAMPPVSEQMAITGSYTNPNLTAARFLLKPGRKYQEAVDAFQPYKGVKEVNDDARIADASKLGFANDGFFCENAVEMKALVPPDSHHLDAAQGWLELGLHLEANEELEKISPEMRVHPDVLEIRWQIYAKEKRWQACAEIGNAIMTADPDRSFGWMHHSFALHALKRTEEAYIHLATVVDDFPDKWLIPYNLACYCSQLGRFQEAQSWFKKAIAINDKDVPKKGIDDPDLKPMWDNLQTPL
jgi:tetratricopeptide (TPR) repeat protein